MAQAALSYAMEHRPIDAVVSLDSTMENGDPKAPWYKEWKPQSFWLDRAATIRVPVLLVSSTAGTDTCFFDGLMACDRRSLKVPDLSHNDFESTGGVLRARFAYDLRAAKPDDPAAAQIETANRLVYRAVLAFLDGILRQDGRALARLESELPAQGSAVRLVHIGRPKEATKADRADLLHELRSRGVPAAAARCAAMAGCNEDTVFTEAGQLLLDAGE